ncbi:MAG: NAD-dependent epimerase/dehydratase family protein [Bdellovibrionota bacterium]
MSQKSKRALVSGAAGFVGSNLVDHLLEAGWHVSAIDNFSTGQKQFLAEAMKHENFKLTEGDITNKQTTDKVVEGCDWVFHFAANADVRFGLEHPYKDLEQNTIATLNLLESMRKHSVKNIVFSSTSAMYGEAEVIPTPENCPLPIQTSLYGASKLAAEGLISSYAEGFGFNACVFRFASVVGKRYTHGHVFDFYKKLKKNPNELEILGDGTQKKSYLDVKDCIRGIMTACLEGKSKYQKTNYGVFNLGSASYCQVADSAKWISNEMGLDPKFNYTGGRQGWIGDNPFIFLEIKRMQSLGWDTTMNIEQAIRGTVRWIRDNEWILEKR